LFDKMGWKASVGVKPTCVEEANGVGLGESSWVEEA
jgi:hypothetical protein